MQMFKTLGVALILVIVFFDVARGDDQGPVIELPRCPGAYCGRQLLPDGNWSSCGACPRGFRANKANRTSACIECNGVPEFYDWLYLGFMLILALVLHWFCIDSAMRARLLGQQVQGEVSFTKEVLILHSSAFGEVFAAAIITLLLLEPKWTLEIRSCPTRDLSDWYTLFHNPSPQYQETLHCTQEAVFPLYSVVFIFYAWCVAMLLLVRPWLVHLVISTPGANSQPWSAPHPLPRHGKATIYAALYFFPVLAVIHALFAGLIYYSFPYILIVLSLISNATHFAFKEDQTILGLLKSTISNVRNIVILIGHWLLHAYAIVAITQLRNIATHLSLLALVPLPGMFYVFTARFTDPNKMHSE